MIGLPLWRRIMSRNKCIFPLLAIALSIIIAAHPLWAADGGSTPGGIQPLVIRFSHDVSTNTTKHLMAMKFKELVETAMPGKIAVEVYHSGELFNDNQIAEALQLDYVQMAAPSMSKLSAYSKKLQLFDLPFLFKDMDAVDKFQQSDAGQELLASLKGRGLLGLGFLHNGMKQLSASKELKVPGDAEGLKFRIMNSDVLESQFQAVNAESQKTQFSQVYTLLSTGTLDGQENTWSNIFTDNIYTVQPYITESNHGVLDYVVLTSVSFWDNLLPNEKNAIQAALKEALAYANSISSKKNEEAKQKIIQSKRSEILSLSQGQRDEWVKAMHPVWKKYEQEIGKDLIDKAYSYN